MQELQLMVRDRNGAFKGTVSPLNGTKILDEHPAQKKKSKILNGYLDAIQGNIFGIQKEFALRNESITAEQVKAQILHKTAEGQNTLIEVYKYHNANLKNW